MFTDLDAIDILLFGAFAVCAVSIALALLIGYVVCRRTPEPDEHEIAGIGAVTHGAATDQRRGGV